MKACHKVIIVDDEPANLRLLNRVFEEDYEVYSAENGADALELVKLHDIAAIITDQRMPGMTGVQLLQASLPLRPDAIRILITGYTDVQALVDAINDGQVYKYIPKPWNPDELKITIKRALEAFDLKRENKQLIKGLREALVELDDLSMSIIRALADALDAKCDYTSGHSLRVSRFAVAIGRQLGLSKEELQDLEIAGVLHDIGKIGVPESILWKPSRLTPEEQKVMNTHPVRSAQIIGDIRGMERPRHWVLHHHEYLDGSGYPDGLKGDEIPLGSKIILCADAYDAMTSDRPYRKAIGPVNAAIELRKHSGKQFDTQVVDALLQSVGEEGEKLTNGIPEGFLGLSFPAINPLQPGKQFQEELLRQGQQVNKEP